MDETTDIEMAIRALNAIIQGIRAGKISGIKLVWLKGEEGSMSVKFEEPADAYEAEFRTLLEGADTTSVLPQ